MERQARRGISCAVTSFNIDDPPDDGVTEPHGWLAVATASVYDSNPDTGGVLTPESAILAGVVMKTVEGRATASNEADAVLTAVKALLFQLHAEGHIVGGLRNPQQG